VSEAAAGNRREVHAAAIVTAALYGALGALLLFTRLVGLSRSFWHDEILAVVEYVRPGLGEILAGGVNHELFTLLEWATGVIIGESEIAFRLWSVIPFIIGVIIVTGWLHQRVNAPTGVLFLFLATVSPLLLDITPQARGYGIAFLSMSVMMVAALEAVGTGRTASIVAFCIGGVAGALTLPNFAIAFLATALVLLGYGHVRRTIAIGLVVSVLVITACYVPHLGELGESSRVEYGVRIGPIGVLTAPVDQILIPSLVWIDGTVVNTGLIWLPIVAVALVLLVSSPLLRTPSTALIIIAPVVATTLVLWAGRLYVVPRYLSFLLVPIYMLLASGMASILLRLKTRPALLRTAIVFVTLGLLSAGFVRTAADVTRLPREAHRDAAEIIERAALPDTRIVVYAHRPEDVAFYLDRPITAIRAADVVSAVCRGRGAVIYVQQPFVVETVEAPCLDRRAVRHYRVKQYTRGGRIDVWVLPRHG
jgi:hypothetical protein